MHGGGEAGVDARFAGPLTLETNGVVWEGQRAAVTPIGYPDKKHFAGFIGAPILMRYAVQIDYDTHVIRLLDPATYTAPSGATQVPFELQADLPVVRMIVDAGTEPLEARLMVDAGAGTWVDLNRPFVDAHGLVAAQDSPQPAASKRVTKRLQHFREPGEGRRVGSSIITLWCHLGSVIGTAVGCL